MATTTFPSDITFPLDSVLGLDAAAGLQLTATTGLDVVTAVAVGQPVPTRPGGALELGSIGLSVPSGEALQFAAGAAKVGVSFGAEAAAGLGVYDEPEKALAALGLGEATGLDLVIGAAGARFAVLRASYSAAADRKGVHPIGTIGSFSFGASATTAGVTAVIQAFHDPKPAGEVVRDVVASWKLPRHVSGADSLAPRTWIVAEAQGSVAAALSAQVGYDFSFVRDVQAAGLSGDIGLKVDAAARATFGLEVSGRYLVVVGRESEASRVRVRMFKLSRRGVEFGLNLKIGVTGVESVAPGEVDDFVKAVFGVHGAQVVTALARLEAWTDPSTSIGELVAGLANDKALELIESATGIDPRTAFEAGRAALVEALQLWQTLPERVAGELLSILDGVDAAGVGALRDSVTVLASDDEATQRDALAKLFETRAFDATPTGRLLLALADAGLLGLLDRLPDVRRTAGIVADLLDGDVIRRLQRALTDALDLNRVVEAVTEADFDRLDSLLVGRLAAFLDRDMTFAQLDEIRKTIRVVLAKRQDIYDKARQALTTRYGAEIAATWQRTTARTALLDVDLDTSTPDGSRLLAALVRDGDLDTLLTSTSSSVTFHAAMLTHETRRKSTLQVTLPRLSFRTEHANTSLAGVSVQEEGGRLLLYHVDASDVVTDARRRYRSSLSIGLTSVAALGGGRDLRVHRPDNASWSYQLLHARLAMHRGELEMYTRPFLETYMNDRFGDAGQWSEWYTELDRTVEGLLANGPDQFGDALLAMDVSIPGDALLAWMRPQPDLLAASKDVSRAIQRSLKAIIPFYFFQNPKELFQNPSAAALFVWAAIPPTTSARVSGSTLTLHGGKSVYWDHQDRRLRRALSGHPNVAATLGEQFVPIRRRLEELGLSRQASFFTAREVPDWIAAATSDGGDPFLVHLCLCEAMVVHKAVDALKSMQAFVSLKHASPSKAIDRLAEFGADITMAFNKLAGQTVFAKAPVRTLTQGVFLDASRALSATPSGEVSGMLTLTVLKPASERSFAIESFLAGATPAPEDVLLEQRLVGTSS